MTTKNYKNLAPLWTFHHFTYVTDHSPVLLSLLLRHRIFICVTWRAAHLLTTWALLILQLFRHFTYVTAHSPTVPSLHLRHSSFSSPSFASPTSQDLHLRHLASRPWVNTGWKSKLLFQEIIHVGLIVYGLNQQTGFMNYYDFPAHPLIVCWLPP